MYTKKKCNKTLSISLDNNNGITFLLLQLYYLIAQYRCNLQIKNKLTEDKNSLVA